MYVRQRKKKKVATSPAAETRVSYTATSRRVTYTAFEKLAARAINHTIWTIHTPFHRSRHPPTTPTHAPGGTVAVGPCQCLLPPVYSKSLHHTPTHTYTAGDRSILSIERVKTVP